MDISATNTKKNYLRIGYCKLRVKFAHNPKLLSEFDEFMRCQHIVFSSFFRMMQPYLNWLKYQYWLILFFFMVSIYYLFQPIHIVWKLVTLYFIPFYIRRMFIHPIRDLSKKQNIGIIMISIIFAVSMISMWMPIPYYMNLNMQEISYAVVGCDGIEDYYDPDQDFRINYWSMQNAYNECYDPEEGSYFLATPDDITDCKRDMDCEDFAYMIIKCLAPLHNVTCVPDMTFHIDYKVPSSERIGGHVGVNCYFDEEGSASDWFYMD